MTAVTYLAELWLNNGCMHASSLIYWNVLLVFGIQTRMRCFIDLSIPKKGQILTLLTSTLVMRHTTRTLL